MSAADNVVTMDQLIERLAEPRRSGRTVAMANGLFDILHVGHLRYLEAASEEAEILVVAINSDDSARRLKGPSRPVCPELERAELVAGLACVDLVTIFSGDTVEGPLRALRPEVHCKGTDYTADSVPEAGLARELGIRVAIVGDHKSHSTRDIIKKMRG